MRQSLASREEWMVPDTRRPVPRMHSSPGYLAAKVAQRGASLMEAFVGDQGLTPRQYGVLEVVSLYPGLTQQEIATALELDRTTVSQLVDDLTVAGLVRRRPSASNRRANAIDLTASGRCALVRVRALVERANDELMAALSPRERRQLVSLLRRVLEIEEQADDAPRSATPTAVPAPARPYPRGRRDAP
jgi:DNA-binding MarR family transcriptional regulator